MSTDHIITNTKTGRLVCQHCKVEEAPPHMPCPINVIIDAMDHFEEQHKDCKLPMPETVMSDYIKGFDHGCDYIVAEIERYIKAANSHDALVLSELLARLKMEKK
jgi:hypothetical protein